MSRPNITVTFTHAEATALGNAAAWVARAIEHDPARFSQVTEAETDKLIYAVAALEKALAEAEGW